MHIGEISFCDKVAFNIKSDDTKKYILSYLESKYNIKIIQKHHDKFNVDMLQTLNKNPHMLCVRSNGNPYFLCLVKYHFTQYCIFVDKKIQQGYFLPRMIIVNLQFKDDAFDNTIMDGEMVKLKNGTWSFVLNDILCIKGQHLTNTNLPKRINILYDFLKTSFVPNICDPFKVCVKRMFTYDQINDIQDYCNKLPYTVRGLYIKPLFLKFKNILINYDDNLIKKVEKIKYKNIKQFIANRDDITSTEGTTHKCDAKTNDKDDGKSTTSAESHVSDEDGLSTSSSTSEKDKDIHHDFNRKLWVRKTSSPDVYELFDDDNNNVGIACVPTMKLSKKMREIMAEKNMVDKVLLEFEFSPKFKKWVLVCH